MYRGGSRLGEELDIVNYRSRFDFQLIARPTRDAVEGRQRSDRGDSSHEGRHGNTMSFTDKLRELAAASLSLRSFFATGSCCLLKLELVPCASCQFALKLPSIALS